MNRDIIESYWKQYMGHVKERWGHLTDDPFYIIAGKRDIIAGKMQRSYGIAIDKTEKQQSGFGRRVKGLIHTR